MKTKHTILLYISIGVVAGLLFVPKLLRSARGPAKILPFRARS